MRSAEDYGLIEVNRTASIRRCTLKSRLHRSPRKHFLFVVRDGKIRRVKEYLATIHANEVLCA